MTGLFILVSIHIKISSVKSLQVVTKIIKQLPKDVTKKIGKNNPKAEKIKKDFITDRIRQSIDAWGKQPDLLANIIIKATMRLALLISEILTAARELKNKLFHETLEKEYGNKAIIKAEDTADVVPVPFKETITTESGPPANTITTTPPKTANAEQPKPQIPPRPVMPPEAAALPRLQKIKVTLDKHNNLIFEAERERNKLEIELSDLKGVARLTKKKELESRIAIKTETLHEKIQRYKEKADMQNASQPYQSRNKGAR